MQPLAAASLVERVADGARFALDKGWECRLFVLSADLMRVLLIPPGGLREPRTWMVAPSGTDVPWEGRNRLDVSAFERPRFDLDQGEHEVVLQTPALHVRVRLRPFGLEWSTPDAPSFAADRSTHAYEWSRRTGAVRHYMARRPTDRYFGLGDKSGALDKHGRRLRTLALDALGYDAQTSDPLYKHWPYVIVRDRSGVAFGPRWSLGYANTAMALTDAEDAQPRLSDFIDRVVEHAIPISAFHFGSGYSSIGPRRYVFTWNRDKFPDPRALVEKFRRAGIRLIANIKPCLLDDHPDYVDAAARGALIGDATTGEPSIGQFWDGEGAYIDFTHPEGVRWWQEGLGRQLLAYGILGWNDNNEYEVWNDDAASNGFGQAIPIDRSRPLQPLLMTRATYEAQAARFADERVYTVTRAGPPGIQRYAQTWSGYNTTSWHTLRWNIRMGLTMSLSGMFNTGHDVGGFHGPVPDPELLVRWVQNGVFSPRFIMNSWKSGGEVTVPWLHPETLEPIRAAIRFRYRLMPYLYTLFRQAVVLGEPLLRPLFYEFEDDARAYVDCDDF